MMKTSNKIIVALLLVLTMMMGLVTVTSFAEENDETITVYFENNWLWTNVSCHYWNANNEGSEWPGQAMTVAGRLDGHDVYTIELPADVAGIVFTGNKDTDPNALDQSPDITEGITDGAGWKMEWSDGNTTLPITFDPSAEPVEPETPDTSDEPATFSSYTVAGTAGLCGSEWDVTNTANDMTAGENGIYTKTFTSVAAGEHKFKVAADHSWDNNWPSSDYSVNLPTDGCTVVITFDSVNKTVSVAATDADGNAVELGGGSAGEFTSLTVAGVSTLCGANWDPAASRNDMTLNPETGLYEKTFTGIPAGTYECKVAADHAWNQSWGHPDGGEFGNYFFTTFDEHDITITFDPETQTVSHTVADSTGPSEDVPETPGTDFDSCGTITIYLANSANWVNPHVHAWVEGPVDVPYTTWPGLALEWDSDKLLYYIELPEICDSVVFSDAGSPQSADLVIPEDGAIFDNMTNEWSDIGNYTPPVPPTNTTEDITVTVINGAGWDDVYIYYWDADGAEAFVWPGTPMDYVDGVYTATIPAGYYSVIFNNGSTEEGIKAQTPDLIIPTNGKTTIDNSADCLYNDGTADDNSAWTGVGAPVEPDAPADPTDPDTPDEPAKEMTFLQKMAKALLLFLRSIEDFFKNLFSGGKK